MTPIQTKYSDLKIKHPDKLVLVKLGDFYEAFWDDAKELAKLCNLTLTKRVDVPMCGLPYHALYAYKAKLESAGKAVLIVDNI